MTKINNSFKVSNLSEILSIIYIKQLYVILEIRLKIWIISINEDGKWDLIEISKNILEEFFCKIYKSYFFKSKIRGSNNYLIILLKLNHPEHFIFKVSIGWYKKWGWIPEHPVPKKNKKKKWCKYLFLFFLAVYYYFFIN